MYGLNRESAECEILFKGRGKGHENNRGMGHTDREMGARGMRSGVQLGHKSASVQGFWGTGWDAVSLDWPLA